MVASTAFRNEKGHPKYHWHALSSAQDCLLDGRYIYGRWTFLPLLDLKGNPVALT